MAEPKTEERPLRADAERNRQRILDAAAELYAERGLGVSMDEIADHAGVGVGTVYRRFPDRNELIDELFEAKFGEIVGQAEEAAGYEDALEGLRFFVERNATMHADNRGLREALFSSAAGRAKIAQTRDGIAPIVAGIVARAQEQGSVRADLHTLDVPAISMMLAAILDFTGAIRPDHWRRMLDLVFEGVKARDEPAELSAPPLERDEFEQALAEYRTLDG